MTLADIDWPMILAGLGLFLFGIEYMGDGLKVILVINLKTLSINILLVPLKGF